MKISNTKVKTTKDFFIQIIADFSLCFIKKKEKEKNELKEDPQVHCKHISLDVYISDEMKVSSKGAHSGRQRREK